MKHAQYYRNIANGIARIAQAIKLCDEPATLEGSMFTTLFSKEWNDPIRCDFRASFTIPNGFSEILPEDEILSPLSRDTKYNFTLKFDNLDQDSIDSLRELMKPDDDPFNYRDIHLN